MLLHYRQLPKATRLKIITTNANQMDNQKNPKKKQCHFPAFDLSTKRIGFGNGTNRVTTVAYEVKCHPAHSTILKYLLIKFSVLDPFHHPTQTFTSSLTVQSNLPTLQQSKINSLNKLLLSLDWYRPKLQY